MEETNSIWIATILNSSSLSWVITENAAFLLSRQPILNGDGFFVSTTQLSESDPNVYTGRIGRHLNHLQHRSDQYYTHPNQRPAA